MRFFGKTCLSLLLTVLLLFSVMQPALAGFAEEEALPIRWLDYESVDWLDAAQGLLRYSQDGKLGILRADGTVLTGPDYEELWHISVDGGLPVKRGGKWGRLDLASGELNVQCVYSSAQETYAPVNAEITGREGGPYAVATLDGGLLSEYKYWDYSPFCYGLAAVFTEDGWGYADETGAEVIPCRYYSGGIDDFGSDGYAVVKGSDGYNIIDRTGREVLEKPAGRLLQDKPWRAGHGLWGFLGENGLFGFVKAETGEIVIEPQYRIGTDPKGIMRGGVFNEAGYMYVLDSDWQETAIDLNGQRADPALAAPDGTSSDNGLHYASENGKYGFLDEAGSVVVPYVFDLVYDFVDGLALVRKDGRFGLLSDPRKPSFSDVPADAWYAPYVEYAANLGIITGTGGGNFEPEREISRTECLALALKIRSLMRGGDGSLEHAPEDWGRITLTLSDGTVYSGYGASLAGEDPGGLWQWYAYQGMFGYGEYRQALRCLVTEEEKDRINALPDKTATAELNGNVYTGTVHCWWPDSRWAMDFEPDGTKDAASVYGALREAVTYGVDPSEWFRDAVYTLAAAVPEEERIGYSGVSEWRLNGEIPARREDFALAAAAAAGELEEINDISVIPDSDNPEILRLYRAGILNGNDEWGTFAPDRTLTRAEAAALMVRVLDPSRRVKTTLLPLDPVERALRMIQNEGNLSYSKQCWETENAVLVFARYTVSQHGDTAEYLYIIDRSGEKTPVFPAPQGIDAASFELAEDGRLVTFTAGGLRYCLDIETGTLTEAQ